MRFGNSRRVVWLVGVAAAIGCEAGFGGESERPIRVGIIGLDTSHAVAFAEIFNDPEATGPLAEVKVVAGYPGGSPDTVQGYSEYVESAPVLYFSFAAVASMRRRSTKPDLTGWILSKAWACIRNRT